MSQTVNHTAHVFAKLTGDNVQELARVDRECFAFPWSEEQFLDVLYDHYVFGIRCDGKLIAYAAVWVSDAGIAVLSFAVCPDYRRQGVGLALIRRIAAGLRPAMGDGILCMVRERNVDAQVFLRACGLKAIELRKAYYVDPDEDGYLFQLLPDPPAVQAQRHGGRSINRIWPRNDHGWNGSPVGSN